MPRRRPESSNSTMSTSANETAYTPPPALAGGPLPRRPLRRKRSSVPFLLAASEYTQSLTSGLLTIVRRPVNGEGGKGMVGFAHDGSTRCCARCRRPASVVRHHTAQIRWQAIFHDRCRLEYSRPTAAATGTRPVVTSRQHAHLSLTTFRG